MKEEDCPRVSPARGKRGFTLVEMLVVIAIMSILMTAGAIGLSGMGGKGVTSGVASAESLFDEARAIAVGKRVKTRVLVGKTITNVPAENLRRIMIVSEELNADGTSKTPPTWALVNRPTVLPDQVFFSSKFSSKDHNGSGGSLDEMTVAATGTFKAAHAGTYFYYEFNAEGICTTPGASFVIGSGGRGVSASAMAGPPKVTGNAKRDFGGFVVWRNGSTSAFRSPEQISPGIQSLNAGADF